MAASVGLASNGCQSEINRNAAHSVHECMFVCATKLEKCTKMSKYDRPTEWWVNLHIHDYIYM